MIKFQIKIAKPEKQRAHCIAVAIYQDRHLSNAAASLDKQSKGYFSNIINNGDFDGQLGQTLILHHVAGILSERILLVGCGNFSEINEQTHTKAVTALFTYLTNTKYQEVISFLDEIPLERNYCWKIQQSVLIAHDVSYTFNRYKKSTIISNQKKLSKVILTVPSHSELYEAERTLKISLAIAKGQCFCKDLANEPPNVCIPNFLAKEAIKFAKHYTNLNATILNLEAIKSLGMNAFLAVGQGSKNSARLISLEYHGLLTSEKPVVLVGKGITFDTGGHSLKSIDNMIGMKYDMCGGATVLGVMKFAAEAQLSINIVGIIAAAENLPGGKAYRPEDILTTMSGQTVEVLNTDAEGRLALCDALTYAERFNPKVVIDIATLTGACVAALGHHYSGVWGNQQELIHALVTAGESINDKCWAMPLSEEYQEQLNSNLADMSNIGGIPAGAITAACFLSRFARNFHWAHLDIAGTASRHQGRTQVATGRPVSLLAQYLMNIVDYDRGLKFNHEKNLST